MNYCKKLLDNCAPERRNAMWEEMKAVCSFDCFYMEELRAQGETPDEVLRHVQEETAQLPFQLEELVELVQRSQQNWYEAVVESAELEKLLALKSAEAEELQTQIKQISMEGSRLEDAQECRPSINCEVPFTAEPNGSLAALISSPFLGSDGELLVRQKLHREMSQRKDANTKLMTDRMDELLRKIERSDQRAMLLEEEIHAGFQVLE